MAAISGDTITGIRLFSGLLPDELQRIALRLQLRELCSGQVILSRDEPGLELYVILSGRIRVELLDGSGQILNHRARRTCFGRSAWIQLALSVHHQRVAYLPLAAAGLFMIFFRALVEGGGGWFRY